MLDIKILVAAALFLGSTIFGLTTVRLDPATEVNGNVTANTSQANVSTTADPYATSLVGTNVNAPAMQNPGLQAQANAAIGALATQNGITAQGNVNAAANTDTTAHASSNGMGGTDPNAEVDAKLAAEIAAKLNVPVEDALALHASGKDWSQVAQLLCAQTGASGKSLADLKAMFAAFKSQQLGKSNHDGSFTGAGGKSSTQYHSSPSAGKSWGKGDQPDSSPSTGKGGGQGNQPYPGSTTGKNWNQGNNQSHNGSAGNHNAKEGKKSQGKH